MKKSMMLFVCFLMVSLSALSSVSALNPGDIYVVDPSAPVEAGGIYKFSPPSWQPIVISSGQNFVDPEGIDVDANGMLIIGDPAAAGSNGAIFRVNPITGAQTIITSGQYLFDPRGVAVAPDGYIYVADSDSSNYYGNIIKVDPTTGQQTIIYTSQDQNAGPYEITFDLNGDLLFTDVLRKVIRLNPSTGVYSVVSSDGNFVYPEGLVVAQTGDIYVADNSGKVIKVDPSTGAQTLIKSGYPLVCPVDIAFNIDGNLLVSDPCNEPGALISLNPITGAATVLASFGSSPNGIYVVPLQQQPPEPGQVPEFSTIGVIIALVVIITAILIFSKRR